MTTTNDYQFLDELKTFPGISSREYEFTSDREMLETLDTLTPVKSLVGWALKFGLDYSKGQFLGSSVRVSEKQFPELNRMVQRAAEILDMQAPDVYVRQGPYVNAFTMGYEAENVFVVLNSSIVDLLTPRELMFVIGHELGHIKSNHGLFMTIANLLRFGLLSRIPLVNVTVPLLMLAWQRRAEITCDRAGLLCCQDPDAGTRSMAKIALGSEKLIEQVDVDAFLEQARDLNDTLGRWSELWMSHPFLPKRVRALQLFAQSSIYLTRVGSEGERFIGREELERRVGELLIGSAEHETDYVAAVQEADALDLLGVFFVAWSQGSIDEEDRTELARLMKAYKLPDEVGQVLDQHFETKLDFEIITAHLKLFKGHRENVFYTALEFAFREDRRPNRRQKNALYRLAEACGLDSVEGINAVARYEQTVSGQA